MKNIRYGHRIRTKNNKIQFLEDKIGLPDSKIVEEMNRSDLNKLSSEDKCDMIRNRLNETPHNHKEIILKGEKN